MNGFLKWFFVFMSSMLAGFGQIFKGLWNGIKQIFNIKNYIRIFKTYSADFGALGWVLSVLALIVVAAIFVLIILMIVLAVRKYVRFRHSIVSNEDLIEEISDLQRQVVKMTKEKDEIMAMKVAQLGVYDNTALAGLGAFCACIDRCCGYLCAYYLNDSPCCEKVCKIQTLYRQQRGSYRRDI